MSVDKVAELVRGRFIVKSEIRRWIRTWPEYALIGSSSFRVAAVHGYVTIRKSCNLDTVAVNM